MTCPGEGMISSWVFDLPSSGLPGGAVETRRGSPRAGPVVCLISISNADIDRICAQAAEFASDDHVDVKVRQQLATLLFDNAEMRKQLNAYTEGILMQTMERLDQLGANDSSKQLAGPMGGMALPDAKQIAGVTGAVSGLLKGPSQKV